MKLLLNIAGGLLGLAVLALLILWLSGAFEKKISSEAKAAPRDTPTGATAKVEVITEETRELAPGTITARRETVISPRITSTIESIHVRAGESVEAGEVLVELDARDLEARLRQATEAINGADARANEARLEFERAQKLMSQGATTRAEFDRLEAALTSRLAELEQARRGEDEARNALSWATIKSPIAGRVAGRFSDPGDLATVGVSILRLYDPGELRLEAPVRESLAAQLNVGDEVNVQIDASGLDYRARVEEIVPLSDPGSRTFLVKAALPPEAQLYPGMFGRLVLTTGTTERLYVPADAIVRVGQLEFIDVAGAEGVKRRVVRTGGAKGALVEVLAGASDGDVVRVAGR